MNEVEQNKFNITPMFIFSTLKKKWIGVLTWTLVGAVIAFLGALLFITPKYSSTIDLLVNQRTDDSQQEYTAQQADLQAINTYKDVIKKSVILSPVLQSIKKTDNYDGNLSDLQNSITIKNETNSQVISIVVRDKNPYVASDIANAVGKEFTSRIKKMMKVDNVTVVTTAKPNVRPISPNKKLITVLGLVIGFCIGISVALIRELLDTTVKDDKYLTDVLQLTNLGEIYHINSDDKTFKIVNVIENQKKNAAQSRRRV